MEGDVVDGLHCLTFPTGTCLLLKEKQTDGFSPEGSQSDETVPGAEPGNDPFVAERSRWEGTVREEDHWNDPFAPEGYQSEGTAPGAEPLEVCFSTENNRFQVRGSARESQATCPF